MDYQKTYEVTLTHDQWLTVCLAMWDSIARYENEPDLSEQSRTYLENECLTIRRAIRAVLPD